MNDERLTKEENDWLQAESLKKSPMLFQDGCEMRQEAAGIASTRTEAMSNKRNAVMMGPPPFSMSQNEDDQQ